MPITAAALFLGRPTAIVFFTGVGLLGFREFARATGLAADGYMAAGVSLGTFFHSRVVIRRGHAVVRDGPYQLLRHPSYTGALLTGAGVGVLLGSWVSLVIMLVLARRVLQERRAVVWVGVIWLTSPLLAALGTIITPDTPSIFFSLCALACVVVMFQEPAVPERPAREAGLWLAFGVFCGLAMWSKYTTVLLPLSVGLAITLWISAFQ